MSLNWHKFSVLTLSCREMLLGKKHLGWSSSMQKTREPQKPQARPKAKPRVAGGVLAEKPPRPVLRTYEDVFQYALSQKAGTVKRPEPFPLDPDQLEDCA